MIDMNQEWVQMVQNTLWVQELQYHVTLDTLDLVGELELASQMELGMELLQHAGVIYIDKLFHFLQCKHFC